MTNGFPAQISRDFRELEKRLQFRGEREPVRQGDVVQRLDAQTIAGQQQTPLRGVPDRKRKHPAQMVDAAWTELFPQVNDGFGVAGSPKTMTARGEFLAQLAVVVDLAIEDDPDRSIFVADRLLAAVQVDDAQASHAQPDAITQVHTFFIRPSMHQHLAHRADFVFKHRFAVKANDSSNATHDGTLPDRCIQPDAKAADPPGFRFPVEEWER